jgi:hypothetical protein
MAIRYQDNIIVFYIWSFCSEISLVSVDISQSLGWVMNVLNARSHWQSGSVIEIIPLFRNELRTRNHETVRDWNRFVAIGTSNPENWSIGKLCEIPTAIDVISRKRIRNWRHIDTKLRAFERAANRFPTYVRFDDFWSNLKNTFEY